MSEVKPLKKWHIIVFLVIICVSVIFKIYQSMWAKTTVRIGGHTIKVLVADTDEHRFQGWSDKKNMGKYGGMLFVFPENGQHAMVMRDMQFPLDIIWIDGNRIVEIAPNLEPEPGKTESELTPYFSSHSSNLVLELQAGFANKTGIKIGDEVVISKY